MAQIDRMFYQIMALVTNLKSDEEGQGMAEYGLILAVVAVVALVGFKLLGGNLSNQINTVAASL